jgi:hypothetical protein
VNALLLAQQLLEDRKLQRSFPQNRFRRANHALRIAAFGKRINATADKRNAPLMAISEHIGSLIPHYLLQSQKNVVSSPLAIGGRNVPRPGFSSKGSSNVQRSLGEHRASLAPKVGFVGASRCLLDIYDDLFSDCRDNFVMLCECLDENIQNSLLTVLLTVSSSAS